MPTRTDGNASRMNSHCQPSSPQPVTPSSSPEIGDPMIDEIGMANMNRLMTRARYTAGNHSVR